MVRSPQLLVAVAAAAMWAGCQTGERPAADRAPPGPPADSIAAGSAAGDTAAIPDHAGGGLAALRRRAHAMLSAHCGQCHIASLDTAVPGALAVFDLDQPQWYAGMTADQLSGALMRIEGSAPADDSRAFSAFVDAELASRGPGASRQ